MFLIFLAFCGFIGRESPFDENVVQTGVDHDERGIGIVVHGKVNLATFLDELVHRYKRAISLQDRGEVIYTR